MPDHNNIPSWEVMISVIAPVLINDNIMFYARKDLKYPYPFYSEINIYKNKYGFNATVTAFAPNTELAEKAATLFFSRMLDVLSLNLNLSFQLDLSKNVFLPNNNETVKRIVERQDFQNAFDEARLLSLTETTFLRSLSWFRKGKYTQDPFDKFLAFWNSIETVASKYNPNKINCKKKGTICHIWECFKTIWDNCENWPFIGNKKEWIDQCNKFRKDIAHGIIPIDVDSVEKVVEKLPELENVAHKFLLDWRNSQLSPVITTEIKNKLLKKTGSNTYS